MGRRERPIPPEAGALGGFAHDLRQLRSQSGLTYRELANRAHYSPSVLSAAASGMSWPSLEITLAYVAGCGGDVEAWTQRWHRLNREGDESTDIAFLSTFRPGATLAIARPANMRITAQTDELPPEQDPAPDPHEATTVEEFLSSLRQLKEHANRSYADIARITDKMGYPLAKSTVHAMLTRERLPALEHLRVLVAACGQDEHTEREWIAAWDRLQWETEVDRALPDESVAPADEETRIEHAVPSPAEPRRVFRSRSSIVVMALVIVTIFMIGLLTGLMIG